MEFIKLTSINALEKAVIASTVTPKLVICGATENREFLEESIESNGTPPNKIIETSQSINAEEWFIERRNEIEEDWEIDLAENEGEWLGENPNKQPFTLTSDTLSGKPLQELLGAKVDVNESWQIPAIFKYGGWNECPEPEVQCAVWKYWEMKYGARIIGVSGDVIEAIIQNPPTTQQEAMDLAWQQYVFCTDIVDQGVETVSNLGSALINHKYWFFWWD
ncbi:MAG: DUF4253 domain-containing protein [Desulfobulbaceae bacterium]|nr:DUF4253 domain-containing protein [Desulfobulbaceae bacterium]